MIKWPALEIAHHPKAPVFKEDSNPALILEQLVNEMTSTRGPSTSEQVRELLRQAGYVSLWFYLKFICGYAGPYDLLNTDLHVDMANFRQRVATTPGIKSGIFVPRSALKSTICSHGANTWELIRNPNMRIACTSEIYDRAQSFVDTTIGTFKNNEFHHWLYPEHRKANRDDVELILTSRTKQYVEPNLKAVTAGGSTQGIHVDLFDADDIVGEAMLNADHVSGADMARMGNWLHSNLRTLVVSWLTSRVLVVGTRYAIDDPYEPIMTHSKEHIGFWDEMDYALDPEGDWVTYYRPALQGEESIFPDQYSVEGLRRMAEDNPWLYQTQYMNNPFAAKPGDFSQYRVQDVQVEWSDIEETFELYLPDGSKRNLTTADVVAAGDPAASTHRAGTRTSKSATCVVARWSDDVVVLLEADRGFVEPTKFFDWLFGYVDKYGVVLRTTYVEAQAGFKAFIPIGRKEQQLRKKELNLVAVPALGDKEATIRNVLQPFLSRGKLYARKEIADRLREELRIFPSNKMDLLDAVKIAVFKTFRPSVAPDGEDADLDEDERPERRETMRRRSGVSPVSGY